MRIALQHGSTVFPLAGQGGVDERIHSSAADLVITPGIAVQEAKYVRAANANRFDRGNLETQIAFTTHRTFATGLAAEKWALDYDLVSPRTGIVHLDRTDFVHPSAIIVTGTLRTAALPGGSAVTIGRLTYAGIVNGRPSYTDGDPVNGSEIYWNSGTLVWIMAKLAAGVPVAFWVGNDDVQSPELESIWDPSSPTVGAPSLATEWDDPDRRYLLDAIVLPPRRRVIGCAVELNYTIKGGAVVDSSGLPA